MKYVIQVKLTGKFHKAFGTGTTRDINKAYRYTQEELECREAAPFGITHDNDFTAVRPLSDFELKSKIEASVAYGPKLASTIFNFMSVGSNCSMTEGMITIYTPGGLLVMVSTEYTNALVNVYLNNEIIFSISLNTFNFASFYETAEALYYDDVLICIL